MLPYQILTMEAAVERNRKIVTSPAKASPANDWIHSVTACRCSTTEGSAVQTGAEEVRFNNYDPLADHYARIVFSVPLPSSLRRA